QDARRHRSGAAERARPARLPPLRPPRRAAKGRMSAGSAGREPRPRAASGAMLPRTWIALGLALGASIVAVAAVGQRPFVAAWRAFRSPELLDPPTAPAAPASLPVDLAAELDRQLADDYRELTHHHRVFDDEL